MCHYERQTQPDSFPNVDTIKPKNIEGNKSEHPFGKETFDTVLTNAICIRANIHQIAGENICSKSASEESKKSGWKGW